MWLFIIDFAKMYFNILFILIFFKLVIDYQAGLTFCTKMDENWLTSSFILRTFDNFIMQFENVCKYYIMCQNAFK